MDIPYAAVVAGGQACNSPLRHGFLKARKAGRVTTAKEPGLTKPSVLDYSAPMVRPVQKHDRAWRKSRIAARLLYRKAAGLLRPRDQLLARQLGQDPEVENRLIQQALYFLGGSRKHDVDRKLGLRRN